VSQAILNQAILNQEERIAKNNLNNEAELNLIKLEDIQNIKLPNYVKN
jgi:hypothetical protein